MPSSELSRHLALAHILLFHLTSLRDVLGGEPKTLHKIGSVDWGNLESVESVTRPSTKTTQDTTAASNHNEDSGRSFSM